MKDTIAGSVKSKTQWAALAVVILGVLQDKEGLIVELIGSQHIGKIMAAIGLLFMVLRAFTEWSLAEKARGLHKQEGFARVGLLVLLAAGSFAVAGCAALAPMTEPLPRAQSAEPAPVAAARTAIDEANAALIAVNVVIGDNAAARVWTPEQAQAYLDESKAAGRQLDRAREALRAGLPLDAEAQARAVRTLILSLHRRVAAEARR